MGSSSIGDVLVGGREEEVRLEVHSQCGHSFHSLNSSSGSYSPGGLFMTKRAVGHLCSKRS